MKNSKLYNFFSLVKFSHTIFALPFALLGYFIAIEFSAESFELFLLLKIILCMVFARTAAMAFNRYIDRDIDSKNERTAAVREIPRGAISPKSALILVIISCVFFVVNTYFINDLCFSLSPIALIVIIGYSYTKRFTSFCHIILGIGLSLAPLGAYLAVTASFSWLPLYYSIAVLFWVAGFDMIYALQDEIFDKKMGLHSIPVLLGTKNALNLAKVLHLAAAFFIWYAWVSSNGNWLSCVACCIFTILLIYQHSLVKYDDLSKVNLAFFTTNGVASVIFALLSICSFFVL